MCTYRPKGPTVVWSNVDSWMHRMVYFERYFNNIVVCLFFLSEKAMSFINYLYSRLLTIILTFFHLDCKVYAWFWKWFVTSVIWCHMHMHTTSFASSYLFMLFLGINHVYQKRKIIWCALFLEACIQLGTIITLNAITIRIWVQVIQNGRLNLPHFFIIYYLSSKHKVRKVSPNQWTILYT